MNEQLFSPLPSLPFTSQSLLSRFALHFLTQLTSCPSGQVRLYGQGAIAPKLRPCPPLKYFGAFCGLQSTPKLVKRVESFIGAKRS